MFPAASLKSALRRPPVVILTLALAAVVLFGFVSHLVNRFREQERALARHLYAQGQWELDSGRPQRAVEYFRAALSYNRDDFQYQLNLARALRDSGLIEESKSYLMSLWERAPEDGTVNLALGRLAVREGTLNDAVHYYHNAVYGVWNSDAESHRRNAQFELVDYLLRQNLRAQADAELMTLAASLPPDSSVEVRVAQMFDRAGDYERALSEYQLAVEHDSENAAAQLGAGEAAFQLHRYRTAAKYLGSALKLDPHSESAVNHERISKLVIDADPFIRRLSSAERERRINAAFDRAGNRLEACAKLPEATNSSDVAAMRQEWLALKTKTSRSKIRVDAYDSSSAMDIVFRIEHFTQNCAGLTDFDQALLLLAQDSDGADR